LELGFLMKLFLMFYLMSKLLLLSW